MPFSGDAFAHLFDWEKDPQRQEKIVNSRLEAEFDGIDTGLSSLSGRVTTLESGGGSVTAASPFGSDNRLIRSDGTGRGAQASGVTLDDSNNVSGAASVATYVDNADTTPLIRAEQDGSGDAAYTALLTGGQQWTWGIDNSASGDPWKLSASSSLGTTDILHVTTGGSVGVNGVTPTLAGSVVQTDVFDVAGQLRVRQGGNGDADGNIAVGPYGFFSGNNWNGTIMMGFNLASHSTGSADRYRTPYSISGACAIEMIGPGWTSFYNVSGAQSAGSDITPTLSGRIDQNGAWYFPTVGTTASGANAVLNNASSPANQLLRSTSSLRYKTDVRDLEPDDLATIDQLRPIKYRSLAKADDPRKEHFGLIAEEVHQADPRLVHYSRDENGELIPDGVQYDRIAPLLIGRIRELSEQIEELRSHLFPESGDDIAVCFGLSRAWHLGCPRYADPNSSNRQRSFAWPALRGASMYCAPRSTCFIPTAARSATAGSGTLLTPRDLPTTIRTLRASSRRSISRTIPRTGWTRGRLRRFCGRGRTRASNTSSPTAASSLRRCRPGSGGPIRAQTSMPITSTSR